MSATAVLETAPTIERAPDGTPYLQCRVGLRVTATGTPRGEWLGATLRWYAGTTRDVPFDTIAISAEELRGAWNEGPEIVPGQMRTTGVLMSATVPFWADVDLHFRATSGDRHEQVATAPFRCGPEIPADAPPPQVTSLTVDPPVGALEPGDTLVVSYTATSVAALWRSAVVLTGPCEVSVEHVDSLASSVTRTVRLALPPSCALDVPITVGAVVLDGAARSASRTVQTAYRLVDVTPPTVTPLWFPPGGGSATWGPLAGTMFVGDSLQVLPNAGDAVGVAWLVWEVMPSGERDSLPITGATWTVRLPVRPSWRAMTAIRLRARDRSGNESAWSEIARGTLWVGDDAPRPSRTLAVAGEIRWATVDPKRNAIYLLQSNEHRIKVVDVASMTVARTIELGRYAVGMDLTAGGDSLLLGLPSTRSLGVLDLRSATPTLTEIALPGIDPAQSPLGPQQVMAMANGHAFVLVEGITVAGWQLFDVNLATGAARVRTDADAAGVTVIRSLDQRVLLLQGSGGPFQRWSSATDAFTSAPAPARANAPLALDGTGALAATGRHLYDANLAFLRSAQSPLGECTCEVPVALSRDAANLYYLLGRGIYRSRTSDGVLLDRSRFTLPATFDFWTQALVLTWPGSDRLVTVLSNGVSPANGVVVVME